MAPSPPIRSRLTRFHPNPIRRVTGRQKFSAITPVCHPNVSPARYLTFNFLSWSRAPIVTNLGVLWPDLHEILNVTTRSTIIYETTSPDSAGNIIYILYGFKYTVRVIQTHTVGFCGPFRSRSVTLLLDPTTLGKPDFRSRTLVRRRTHSELDYLPKYTQRYTVVYLRPIRSLLDPFQVSHTIIGTSDSLGLPRTHSELPGLGLSP